MRLRVHWPLGHEVCRDVDCFHQLKELAPTAGSGSVGENDVPGPLISGSIYLVAFEPELRREPHCLAGAVPEQLGNTRFRQTSANPGGEYIL